MPKVSAIVPNYNHARFLRKRIETILAQTFQDFELILLDDCSTDDSRSILRSYASDPRTRLNFNEKNSGSTYKQWNKGVQLARGEYVWIAESDDYADPHLLERLVQAFEAKTDTVLAFCRSFCLTADGRVDGFAENRFWAADEDCWSRDYFMDGQEVCRRYMVRRNIVLNASSALFRKATYNDVGGADETMRLCSDWKLWAAMMLRGRVAYFAQPLNYYRFHGQAQRYTLSFAETTIPEYLTVTRWIEDRATPSRDVLRRAYRDRAVQWVPLLMSSHIPRKLKKSLLTLVMQSDPHPFRHAIRPALTHVRLKFLRHWRQLTRADRAA